MYIYSFLLQSIIMIPLTINPPIILCFSTTALKWPLYCEEEDQKWSPNKPFPQNLSRTPTSTWSQGSGSYTVLPPIGKQMMVKEPELCPPQSVNTTYPIYTHSSGGYLVQMEKQKQQRERVTYKVGELSSV